MELVSHASLPATLISWSRKGAPSSTLVCKITFELSPGVARVAAEQVPLFEADQHDGGDPGRSLVAASDLAPFRARAEVLLVGHAYAPGGEPARSVVARLAAAGVDKSIEVHCDRVITDAGALLDGPWFTEMPLVYERAAGGPGTDNPVGVAPDARAAEDLGTRLPNLEVPGEAPLTREARTIACFGPIAATWPARAAKAGRHLASLLDGSWMTRSLPKEVDAAFFHAAPEDQITQRFAEGLRITLEHLHPTHPRLVCALPHVRPRVFTEAHGALEEFALEPDTLFIDTTRAIATLTYRGQVSPRPGAHRAHVILEETARPYTQADVRRVCGISPSGTSTPPPAAPPRPSRPPSPTPSSGASQPPPRRRPIRNTVEDVTWADDTNGGDASPEWLRKVPVATTTATMAAATTATTAQPPKPPATVWSTPAHVHSEGYAPDARASRPAPTDDLPFGRASFSSIAGASGPLAIPVSADPLALGRASGAEVVAPTGASAVEPPHGAALLALSNAAAQATRPARVAEPAEEPRPASASSHHDDDEHAAAAPILDLLWLDAASMDRVRATTRWIERIAASRPPTYAPDEPGAAPPEEDPPEVRDRCDVLAVLSGCAPTPASGLGRALADAAKLRRGFAPPLVVAVGELTPSFDEIDTLKATLGATSPFAAGDKKLKEATDLATELLATPWLDGATDVIESLITRVRDAFQHGARGLPPGFLDARVERTLLRQRKYMKVHVLGGTWIRAQLDATGGGAVPVYLDEALAERMPLFRRFAVRLIAEVHLAQDQFEAHPHALRAIAVAREAPAAVR
ncbi:MAG TPA: DUF2169 domain-containing protein [Polyangia bacterium]|nr:DUF2169 domain-containing protein [Polyangia bacterium]